MTRWRYMVCPECTSTFSVQMAHCPYCGKFLDIKQLQGLFKDVDKNTRSSVIFTHQGARKKARNPTLAILLSILIPGSGQMYLGNVPRGIVIFISTFVLLVLTIGFLLWIINIFDIVVLARAYKKEQTALGS